MEWVVLDVDCVRFRSSSLRDVLDEGCKILTETVSGSAVKTGGWLYPGSKSLEADMISPDTVRRRNKWKRMKSYIAKP